MQVIDYFSLYYQTQGSCDNCAIVLIELLKDLFLLSIVRFFSLNLKLEI